MHTFAFALRLSSAVFGWAILFAICTILLLIVTWCEVRLQVWTLLGRLLLRLPSWFPWRARILCWLAFRIAREAIRRMLQ